ncbi:hypothetical protein [Geodermatophilus sp. URMC 65]
MTVMKIDEFAVPGPSLDEFLAEAGRTQSVLAGSPAARRAVETDHRARGFDRTVFRDRLGVSSDEGLHEPAEGPALS